MLFHLLWLLGSKIVEIKLRKVGNSVALIVPKRVRENMGVAEGSSVYLTETPDGFRVTSKNPNFAEKMKVAEGLSRRYRNALDELAKWIARLCLVSFIVIIVNLNLLAKNFQFFVKRYIHLNKLTNNI